MASAAPANRLWCYLVRQEAVQDIFIRSVFGKRRSLSSVIESNQSVVDGMSRGTGEDKGSDSGNNSLPEPVRIIHKEQDSISAFCLNQVRPPLRVGVYDTRVQLLNDSFPPGQSWSHVHGHAARGTRDGYIPAVGTPILVGRRVRIRYHKPEQTAGTRVRTTDKLFGDTGIIVDRMSIERSMFLYFFNLLFEKTAADRPLLAQSPQNTPQTQSGIAGQSGRGASVVSY